jgi:hypothetical protein
MPGHLEMFKRLHKDFSDSDLKSIRVKDDKVLMVIERKSDKHLVTLELSYAADENYKLNRLSIEAGEM